MDTNQNIGGSVAIDAEPNLLTPSSIPSASVVRADIARWIDTLVIGENLCPFAGRVWREGNVSLEVADVVSVDTCLYRLLSAADRIAGAAEIWATHLLVLPDGFACFDDFLDLSALAESVLIEAGYEGVLQIASFHPDYRFADAEPDAVANWTNRSPYPVLQLLQEASVTAALERHADPTSIPRRNIAHLEAIGLDGIRRRLAATGVESSAP